LFEVKYLIYQNTIDPFVAQHKSVKIEMN